MLNSKTLIGGIAGGVLYFLLGYLIYGVLLPDFMMENYNSCMDRAMEDYAWWALISANFVWGFFLAITIHLSGAKNLLDGLKTSFVAGGLVSLGMALSFFSMSSMYHTRIGAVADVLISTAFFTLVGGIITLVMQKFGKTA